MKKINYLNPIKPLLNSVSCLPLLRIYQKYNTKNGVWFKDLGKKLKKDLKARTLIKKSDLHFDNNLKNKESVEKSTLGGIDALADLKSKMDKG